MSCLEDITVGSFVRGLIINDIAEIIALKRRGKSVLEVTFNITYRPAHFSLSAPLDKTRIGRDVQRLFEEIISPLLSVEKAEVKVSLEIEMSAHEGVTHDIVRAVSENCNTLRFENFEWD